MNRQKALLIDFAGSSCSGKTFIKNAVFKRLSTESRCIDISDEKISAKDCFSFFSFAPSAFFASLALVLLSIPVNYKAAKLLKKLLTVQVKIRKSYLLDCDYVLLDEGLFKWLAIIRRLGIRKLSYNKMPVPVRKKLLYPHITVLVTSDFETIQHRKTLRGRAPDLRDRRSIQRFDENLSNLQNDIISAQKSGLLKAIRYNNAGNFDDSLIKEIRGTSH